MGDPYQGGSHDGGEAHPSSHEKIRPTSFEASYVVAAGL